MSAKITHRDQQIEFHEAAETWHCDGLAPFWAYQRASYRDEKPDPVR